LERLVLWVANKFNCIFDIVGVDAELFEHIRLMSLDDFGDFLIHALVPGRRKWNEYDTGEIFLPVVTFLVLTGAIVDTVSGTNCLPRMRR
jgi:hypothetical protein